MKAVIMAAGKGTRMLPLTLKTPKVLLEIDGKPFLHYILTNLEKAGIGDIALIVGYRKEMIKHFIDTYAFKVELIEQKEQKGSGHAVNIVKEFVTGENFIVLGGDNLWSARDIISVINDDNLNYVCGVEYPDPGQYGVLNLDGEYLASIIEKPKEYAGNLINTGLYKFTPEIFDALEKIRISPRGEYELTDAITLLAQQRRVKVKRIRDYWKDLGNPEDIPSIEYFIRKGKW